MNKLKHLEMIQNVITRMASNSFLVKGWSMVLVTATFALAVPKSSVGVVAVALLPAIVFWGLDGYFLWQERLYRDLYNRVRMLDESAIDFSMNAMEFKNRQSWIASMMSSTMIPFHGSILFSVVIVMIVNTKFTQ